MRSILLSSAAALLSLASSAQEPKPGRLKISVSPSEAYSFLDLKAIGPGDQSIEVAPGDHKVMVGNYGFKFFQQDIDIQPGQTTSVTANLEPSRASVSGPEEGCNSRLGCGKLAITLCF
jgi:hypothetical protein